MLSVSYASKNAYSAGKTSGVLRGESSGANKCYVLAHCGVGGYPFAEKDNIRWIIMNFFMNIDEHPDANFDKRLEYYFDEH